MAPSSTMPSTVASSSCLFSFAVVSSLFIVSGLPGVTALEDEPCRLWLAPSYLSTEENPQFGLFAGSQGFKDQQDIPSHELAIPLYDFLSSPASLRNDRNRAIAKFLETSMWVSEYAGSQFEANHSTSAFIPGLGALSLYHSGYANVEWKPSSILFREADAFDTAIRRQAHPTRGSITPYYNATMVAMKDIPGGMELFGNYGDSWDDKKDDIYQDKLTRNDYDEADKVLNRIMEFMEKHDAKLKEGLKTEILDFMLDKILGGVDGKHAKTLRMLIPDRPDKLQSVKDAGGTFLYRNREMIRSDDWFQEHGMCVDNLEPGMSTVPEAGRGAFAKRDFAVEDIISPVPMMPILFEEVLELYNETREVVSGPNGEVTYELDHTKHPKGMHLIYNYCFGHPESNLLLLPTAPVVNYINHAPTKEQVNAILVWSKHDHLYNDHNHHDRPLQAWTANAHPPIMMMLTATQDIKKGDEIFIDYGEAWAAEYASFKASWEAHHATDKSWPLRAVDLRGAYKDKPFPVDIKQGQLPYPPGVVTVCYIDGTEEMPDALPRVNHFGQRIMKWTSPKTIGDVQGRHMSICDIVNRTEIKNEDGTVTWEYSIITKAKDTETGFMEVRFLPHHAVSLAERPYASDLHVEGAFRGYIQLEDQKFPQEWRNLRD